MSVFTPYSKREAQYITKIKLFPQLFFLLISINYIHSCKPKDDEFSTIENIISKAEINIDTLTENDWSTLNIKIQKLGEKFDKSPKSYSQDETQRLENLKSRHLEILETKEASDFNQSLNEWSKIIKEAGETATDSL